MILSFFSVAIAVSGISAIYFRQKSSLSIFGVLKALTTVLIIVLSLILNLENDAQYGWIITLALLFSLLGDVLLLKKSFFIYGLGAFLIAHVLFIYAFSTLLDFQPNFFVLAMLLIIGLVYYRYLYPTLKSYALPVAIYVIAIVILDWQAISLLLIEKSSLLYLIGLGAILFSISDAILGYKKFKEDIKFAEVYILSTYWLAIYLYCVSISFVQ